MRKRTNWRETISHYNVHTRDGRERFLADIAKAYFALYPSRARYLTRSIKELNKLVVGNGDNVDAKGRTLYLKIRVPTELMLFIQRWIPEFGRDSADIDLLRRCWPDLSVKDRRRRSRMQVQLPTETAPCPKK